VYVVTVSEYVAPPFDTGKPRHSWLGCATAWGFGNGLLIPTSLKYSVASMKAG